MRILHTFPDEPETGKTFPELGVITGEVKIGPFPIPDEISNRMNILLVIKGEKHFSGLVFNQRNDGPPLVTGTTFWHHQWNAATGHWDWVPW